jgi:hypothetical protein
MSERPAYNFIYRNSSIISGRSAYNSIYKNLSIILKRFIYNFKLSIILRRSVIILFIEIYRLY